MATTFTGVPNTEVYLLNVPLINDGANTLTFSSASAQASYFIDNCVVGSIHFEDYTYQRKDGIMRVNRAYDTLLSVNYVMYKNTDFGDKWFYAFVESEYVNPTVTNLHLTTDYWQTFQFQIKNHFGYCRIEREIVDEASDGILAYDDPEPVSAYQFKLNSISHTGDQPYDASKYEVGGYIVASQIKSDGGTQPTWGGGQYNGTYYPLYMYLAKGKHESYAHSLIDNINSQYDGAISYVQSVPKLVADNLTISGEGVGLITTPAYATTEEFTIDLTARLNDSSVQGGGGLSGYQIRNNKTLNFTTLVATNNEGGGADYNLLDWDYSPNNYAFSFKAYANIDENCKVAFVPLGYKTFGLTPAYDYGFSSATYPTVGFAIAKYNYFKLQQAMFNKAMDDDYWNKVASFGSAQLGNMATIGMGAGMSQATSSASLFGNSLGNRSMGVSRGYGGGNMAQGAMGAVTTTLDLIPWAVQRDQEFENNARFARQQYRLENPYQFGGLAGCVSTLSSADALAPVFYWKCPKKEDVKRIDTFFDMYGYSVDRTGKPNYYRRPNWDYCKCSNVTIKRSAGIPEEAREYLQKSLLNGMTFWHDPDTIYDYSENNRSDV